jgi:hypothetical protein
MGLAIWLQGMDFSLPGSDNKLILAFLGLLAVAVLLQACVLLAMAIGARKTHVKIVALIETFEERLNPLLDTTRVLLDDAAPKVRLITTNVAEASYILREQVENISGTVDEFNARARNRIVMADEMISLGLHSLNRAVETIQDGMVAPLRQLSGLLAGLRTGVDVLRNKGRKTHVKEDQDMFV